MLAQVPGEYINLPSRGSSTMCMPPFPQGMCSPTAPHMGGHMGSHIMGHVVNPMDAQMSPSTWGLSTPLQVGPAAIPTPQAGYSRKAPGSPDTSSPRGTHVRSSTDYRCDSDEDLELKPNLSPSSAGILKPLLCVSNVQGVLCK